MFHVGELSDIFGAHAPPLLSLTSEVSQLTQSTCPNNLIFHKPPPRSSSVVTLVRLQKPDSLKISNRSLWSPSIALEIAKTHYISRMFYLFFPTADCSTSLNRHFRNVATWRGSVGNRSFAMGFSLKCP